MDGIDVSPPGPDLQGLFLHCRPGFESDCAAEIIQHASALDIPGYCRAAPATAYVLFVTQTAEDARNLYRRVRFSDLVFCRQWFRLLALADDLPLSDRVSGLAAACRVEAPPAGDLFLETTDTNHGKELQTLCRRIAGALRGALQAAGLLNAAGGARRLHVCFMATDAAYVGVSRSDNASPYPMGIPRLRFPPRAPSRSTLKLEEALLAFLTPQERERALRPGMRAVDLGAAPGGWTLQLVQRGLRVTAVDNGALAPAVLDSGLVEHRRADGFRFRPPQPVDWMVCDIVEQPGRIATLAAQWLTQGWCKRTIFNLKLPMKKRHQAVTQCLDSMRARLTETGRPWHLGCKQLYHDREEVTVFAELAPPKPR